MVRTAPTPSSTTEIALDGADGGAYLTRPLHEDPMKFRPLYDRVLVKRLESEQKTAGGLFLPEAAKEKPQQAEVIAVGTGRLTEKNEIVPLTVKKGDRVL